MVKEVALVSIVLYLSVQLAVMDAGTDSPYLQIYPPVNSADDRTDLYFALMLSFRGDYVSIGALPGVQIALDYINSQPSILPGYILHYTLTDSQVCCKMCALANRVCFFPLAPSY